MLKFLIISTMIGVITIGPLVAIAATCAGITKVGALIVLVLA
ncbi:MULTISPECIES: hypothetical protein [unclassified Bradyrhizobium]|nr:MULTISPECIES: hypothetical protein [unclassified Bradyrhizobium]